MATREEKLKLVEELKAQIEVMKNELEDVKLEEVKQDKKPRSKTGTILSAGIIFLLIALGLGIAGYFLFK